MTTRIVVMVSTSIGVNQVERDSLVMAWNTCLGWKNTSRRREKFKRRVGG
jgi:hypothetical protein